MSLEKKKDQYLKIKAIALVKCLDMEPLLADERTDFSFPRFAGPGPGLEVGITLVVLSPWPGPRQGWSKQVNGYDSEEGMKLG